MRILYFYSSQRKDTGSPRALVRVVEALDRKRYEPLFWATGDGPLVDVLTERGIQVVRGDAGPVSYRQPVAAARRVAGKVAALGRLGVDVLHVNEFGWNLDLVFGAALRRIPIVLHVHNPLTVAPRNLNGLLADRVVFVSEAHRSATPGLDTLRRKTVVLPNSVDTACFAAGRSIRESLGIDPSHLVIGTVAQISRRKGIDLLLEVARRLLAARDDVRFVIVGHTGVEEESFAGQMRKLAQAPPLAGRVSFLGSRDDIPDLMASMDVFFLPTRAEPFGMVIIEAMAAGLPVVATRTGGIPEIITRPDLGFAVAPEDVDGYVYALQSLLDSPLLRRDMGAGGRRSLVGRFDDVAYGRALDTLYGELPMRGTARGARPR